MLRCRARPSHSASSLPDFAPVEILKENEITHHNTAWTNKTIRQLERNQSKSLQKTQNHARNKINDAQRTRGSSVVVAFVTIAKVPHDARLRFAIVEPFEKRLLLLCGAQRHSQSLE